MNGGIFRAALFMLLFSTLQSAAAAEVREFKDPVVGERYYRLIDDLRCLVCQNQSLADSDADLAKDLRDEVYQILVSGKSDEEAIKFLVDRYGAFVLYRPPVNRMTLLLWAGPFVLLGTGLLFIWRRTRRTRVENVPEALSVAERERLRRLEDGTGE